MLVNRGCVVFVDVFRGKGRNELKSPVLAKVTCFLRHSEVDSVNRKLQRWVSPFADAVKLVPFHV